MEVKPLLRLVFAIVSLALLAPAHAVGQSSPGAGDDFARAYQDQNGFKVYLSLCPSTRTASLLAFNTETRSTTTGAGNLLAPESKIARSVLGLFQSIPTK